MVVKIFFLSFLLSINTFALEGEVTVLEAPIFGTPDTTGPIIQYARKGETIYIHQQEAAKEEFHLNVSPITIDHQTTQKYDEKYQDPLFQKPEDTYLAKDENPGFYRTVDKRGRIAYILKDQVHVYFEDPRELTQTDISPDPTDYRISEPLPPNYPFIQEIGHKGYIGLGMGKPSDNFYPAGNLRDTTSNSSFQFWANWSKQIDFDQERRLYWGWTGVFESYNNTYLREESLKGEESTMRLAFGPGLNYDLWRIPKTLLNVAGSLLFNFYYQKEVSTENTLTKDINKDVYKSYFITPTITVSLQRLDVGPNLDFMIGSNILMDLPHTMRSETGDQYDQEFNLNFGLFIAAQTSY